MARCEVCGRPYDDEPPKPGEPGCGGCHAEYAAEIARLRALPTQADKDAETARIAALKPGERQAFEALGGSPILAAETRPPEADIEPLAHTVARRAHEDREINALHDSLIARCARIEAGKDGDGRGTDLSDFVWRDRAGGTHTLTVAEQRAKAAVVRARLERQRDAMLARSRS